MAKHTGSKSAQKVSENKETEKELHESRRRLFNLMDNLPGMAYRCKNDPQWTMEFVSSGCLPLTGYKTEALVNNCDISYNKLIHPNDRDTVWNTVQEALRHKEPFKLTYRIRTIDGIEKWVWEQGNGVYSPEGKLEALEGFITDITERKMAEDKLQESEERFRAINDSVIDSIITINSKSFIVLCNRATEKIFGYPASELVGQNIGILMPEQYREAHRKGVVKYLATGEFSYLGGVREFSGIKKDGSEFPIELSLSTWKAGEQVYFTGIIRDITDRKEAENILRVSEEKYHNLMDHAADAILIANMDGNLMDANKKAEELFGYTRDELITMNFIKVHPREGLKKTIAAFQNMLLKGSGTLIDGAILRKDGSIVPVDITGSLIAFGEKIVLQGIFRDITERKKAEEDRHKLEEQLLQAQKMEAIGQLAGGIAHDFNNILTAIITYGHFLKMKMKADDPLRNYSDQILTLSEKAASLTQSLLAFSRKQILNPLPVDLNEIVRNVEKFLYRIIGEDIEFKTLLFDRSLTVMADHVQIEQVLMNLATNARDAMPEGGSLTVRTGIMELEDAFIRLHGYGKPGSYALLTITDTGAGMDEKTRSKIFEPFFTTKELGKGTGLGLAMAYGIIKQHEGFINVYSEPGQGTTFTIYLPLVTYEHRQKAYAEYPLPESGYGTILLAEDNTDVRKSTRDMLEEFGYTVIEAVDGEDAVARFNENMDRVDLVVLDVVMPNKSGKEAYEDIKRINPGAKTVFMSGYAEDLLQKKGIPEDSLGVILKPVQPRELLNKIREALKH